MSQMVRRGKQAEATIALTNLGKVWLFFDFRKILVKFEQSFLQILF